MDYEQDIALMDKHSYNYGYLKYKYPNVGDLPRSDINSMLDIVYKSPSIEQADAKLDEYVQKINPAGQQQSMYPADNVRFLDESYIGGKENMWKSNVDNKQPATFGQSQPKTQNDELSLSPEEKLVNDFYKHLKNKDIEGYTNHMYCDTIGKNTVGPGLYIPNGKYLEEYTMTQKTPNRTTMSNEEKYQEHNNMHNFCGRYYRGKDENGNDVWKVSPADDQPEEYKAYFQREIPRFIDAELEKKAKMYIRDVALPQARRQMKNINLDFDQLPPPAQKAILDLAYNLSPKKFKLGYGSVADGFWPKLTDALLRQDYAEAAKQVHRWNVGPRRNKIIADLMREAADYK